MESKNKFYELDGYVIGETSSGERFYFDIADYAEVCQYCWHKQGNGYVHAKVSGKKVLLHRFLLNLQKGQQGDHIDGNRLNNRRSNLRVCTHAENMRNCKGRQGVTSVYKGVSLDKKLNKWRADIRLNRKTIYIGVYADEVEAASAYNQAALRYHGAFARVNDV